MFPTGSRSRKPSRSGSPLEGRGFIEVKGRAQVGEVALTSNEFKTAQRLQDDYWLYVVYNCATSPALHAIQNPARLGWQPMVTVEHYHVGADEILGAS